MVLFCLLSFIGEKFQKDTLQLMKFDCQIEIVKYSGLKINKIEIINPTSKTMF